MLSGLDKFSVDKARQRASIPKWQVQNTAYHSCYSGSNFASTLADPALWGRHVESAVGNLPIRATKVGKMKLFYWRDKSDEMDFVLLKNNKVIGIEVKSGKSIRTVRTKAFATHVKPDKIYLVGKGGMPWEEFLLINPSDLF
ncbi:MAG: DUF4143 domain-containing protein [Cytophagales bacterium]